MATRDDVLREKTFKDNAPDLGARIYYTLTSAGSDSASLELKLHRTCKAVSLLAQHLVDKGILSAEQLDELLLECI